MNRENDPMYLLVATSDQMVEAGMLFFEHIKPVAMATPNPAQVGGPIKRCIVFEAKLAAIAFETDRLRDKLHAGAELRKEDVAGLHVLLTSIRSDTHSFHELDLERPDELLGPLKSMFEEARENIVKIGGNLAAKWPEKWMDYFVREISLSAILSTIGFTEDNLTMDALLKMRTLSAHANIIAHLQASDSIVTKNDWNRVASDMKNFREFIEKHDTGDKAYVEMVIGLEDKLRAFTPLNY